MSKYKNKKKHKKTNSFGVIISLLVICVLGFAGGKTYVSKKGDTQTTSTEQITSNYVEVADSEQSYVTVNDNLPDFSEEDKQRMDAFEYYSELDGLGRCGVAYANICTELMPTEERGKIGSVKPSGWHSSQYDFVEGKHLYNRCHLIAFMLAGENANEKNLITGTRYLNVQGMLPFENMVADYVKSTNHHVLYRVTPKFEGDNLVASGVYMEAYSVEDQGQGICFYVYVFNKQPGVKIYYETGDNELDSTELEQNQDSSESQEQVRYILNKKSKKFHHPECSGVADMKENNKSEFIGTRDEAIKQGYLPCGLCNP